MERQGFSIYRCATLLIAFLSATSTLTAQIEREIDLIDFQSNSKPVSTVDLEKSAVNDACSNATVLAIDGGCNAESTNGCSLEGGEPSACLTAGGGVSLETDWYRFNTGALTSVNLSWLYTNTPNCFPGLAVWGPFAPGGGCLPAAGTNVHCMNIQNLDPGYHTQLTGLTAGSDYLIQVAGRNCGGGNDRFINYCVGVYTPQTNNTVSSPSLIDQCGVTFNGTNTGYSASGTGPQRANLDGNAGTQCPTCLATNEVPYVINNDSWFSFCASAAGTWQVDLSGIANCGLNIGIQMTLMRGTPTNLTYIESAGSPQAPGSSWTSATFAVAAGECIYMVVDGFAGDMCDYQYTLTNITGGCNLLDISFLDFNAEARDGKVNLDWTASSSGTTGIYTVERSEDNETFTPIASFQDESNAHEIIAYHSSDENAPAGLVYYRIRHVDQNSVITYSNVETVEIESLEVKDIYPNPATDFVNLDITAYESADLQVRILNLNGQELLSSQTSVERGSQNINLNVAELASGIYFLQIRNGHKIYNSKLILD